MRWQGALLLAGLLVGRACADGLKAVVVGPDGTKAHVLLVDADGATLPGPQDHVKVASGGQSLGEAIVYRIQGKRLTLYFLGSAALPAAGAELDLAPTQGHPTAAVRPAPVVQVKPSSPQYEDYKKEAIKSLNVLDRLIGSLPDTSMSSESADLQQEMASKAWGGGLMCGDASRAMLNMAEKAPDKDIYSGQVARDTSHAIDDLRDKWGAYVKACQDYAWHKDRVKGSGNNANARNTEEEAASAAETAVDQNRSSMTDLAARLKNNRVIMQDAIDKNN